MNKRFLPHIVSSDDYLENLNSKCYFLGYMTRQLILTELGFIKLSDRDSLIYKSVRLPGKIMNDMFREFYEDYLKKVKSKTDRLIELDKTPKNELTSEYIMNIILENSQELFDNSELISNINRSFMGKWGKAPHHLEMKVFCKHI